MIIVSCPMKQDFIIECLETCEVCAFRYEGKTGIQLKFSVDVEDYDAAIQIAKARIKSTQIGSVLYFQITKEG